MGGGGGVPDDGRQRRAYPAAAPAFDPQRAIDPGAAVPCGGTTAKLFETLIDLGIDAIQVGEERITAEMVNEHIGRPGMA